MGSTNFTPNYNLPQFIGTDKPAWLTDVNGAMSTIDTAIKNAADDASNAVSVAGSAASTATAASNSANALDTQINTPSTGLAAQVTANGTAITNITTTIGNTPLTTVAQTLTGAIEEVKGMVGNQSGTLKLITTGELKETYNGLKTIGQALNTIYASLANVFSALNANQSIRITSGTAKANEMAARTPGTIGLLTAIPSQIDFSGVSVGNDLELWTAMFSANSFCYSATNSLTQTNRSAETPASSYAVITYEVYETIS